MIQQAGLAQADYAGERFADHPRDVKGDPDLLNLTGRRSSLGIHRAYLGGGRRHHDDEHVHRHPIGQADYGARATRSTR